MPSIVALSEVDICNMGISNLGISTGIQSFSDQTETAKICAFWYPKCRDQLLRSAPWNFAFTYLALASDASNVAGTTFAYPGWPYAYQYPNDCLEAIAVTTAYGQRFGQQIWSSYWGWRGPVGYPGIPKIPYKVVQSQAVPGQKAILCDLIAPAYLFYIQCVTNTAMFDVLFSEALSWLFASKAGGPLRANIQKVQACAQIANAKRLDALAQSMNEAQQDPKPDSPSVSVRW